MDCTACPLPALTLHCVLPVCAAVTSACPLRLAYQSSCGSCCCLLRGNTTVCLGKCLSALQLCVVCKLCDLLLCGADGIADDTGCIRESLLHLLGGSATDALRAALLGNSQHSPTALTHSTHPFTALTALICTHSQHSLTALTALTALTHSTHCTRSTHSLTHCTQSQHSSHSQHS